MTEIGSANFYLAEALEEAEALRRAVLPFARAYEQALDYSGGECLSLVEVEPTILDFLRAYQAIFASADTHPKGGDVKQAPLVSGAVPRGQTPKVQRHD